MENFRPGKVYNVTASATSQQIGPFSAGVTIVRLVATANCNVRLGSNPTAVAADTLIPLNYPVFLNVGPGEKLAVVGTGTFNVAECA